jgi:hypothetical protein
VESVVDEVDGIVVASVVRVERFVEFPLSALAAAELVGVFPGLVEAFLGSLGFFGGSGGFVAEALDGLGEALDASFESLDELRRIKVAPLVVHEPHLDICFGDEQPDLVLDDGGRLAEDVEAGEIGHGLRFGGRLGWGRLEPADTHFPEAFAGGDALGLPSAVDDHLELVAAGVGDPLEHGGEAVGGLVGGLGLSSGLLEDVAETTLVVVPKRLRRTRRATSVSTVAFSMIRASPVAKALTSAKGRTCSPISSASRSSKSRPDTWWMNAAFRARVCLLRTWLFVMDVAFLVPRSPKLGCSSAPGPCRASGRRFSHRPPCRSSP